MKVDPQTFETMRSFFDALAFHRFLGMRLTVLREGFARLELPFRPELIGDPIRPALHGGVISTICDSCGGAVAFSVIRVGDTVSTVDLRVDYLRPGREELLIAEGHVLRAGNRVCVVGLRAFHPGKEAEPIAEATGVYNIRRSKKSHPAPPEGG
jgi:uncharacterized protein (TIGR00369 family)